MNDLRPRPTRKAGRTIETDYLVIGAGITGMAFTDTLITESARVVMIDRACQTWWTLDHRLPVRAATSHRPTASTQGQLGNNTS